MDCFSRSAASLRAARTESTSTLDSLSIVPSISLPLQSLVDVLMYDRWIHDDLVVLRKKKGFFLDHFDGIPVCCAGDVAGIDVGQEMFCLFEQKGVVSLNHNHYHYERSFAAVLQGLCACYVMSKIMLQAASGT
jgi:hypothetical protein